MSELVVYLCGRSVGRLILKSNGNMQFRYNTGYAGPAISQSLPIQESAHPHKLCHAVFGGLLLEGDAREVVARNLGVSISNDYALLQEMGGDCAGAITLLAPDVELPTQAEIRHLNQEQLDSLLLELPQRPLAVNPEEGVRLSLAGAQPKLPVIMGDEGEVGLPLSVAAPTTHIIKPEPARFEGLVDNEAFCMELARAVDLPAARVDKHTSLSGLKYLLVERYDRDLKTDPIRRLHQEDVCQALGCAPERKYQSEGGPTVADTVTLLRSCSAVPAQDLQTFWVALVFNWLIGNCDAHAKNFSLLYAARAPTLAPLYDLVSTTVYPELTTRLAMSLDGAKKIGEVSSLAWERLATEVGYSQRFARSVTRMTIDRVVDEAAKLAATGRHANRTVQAVIVGILKRAGE